MGEGADLDLLYDYDASRSFSLLFDQARAILELSVELGAKVALISRAGLRTRLRTRIAEKTGNRLHHCSFFVLIAAWNEI